MSNEPNGDRWSKAFNKTKNSITHGARTKINAAKQTMHEEMIPLEHDIDDLVTGAQNTFHNTVDGAKNTAKNVKKGASNVANGFKKTGSAIKDIAKADGLKGKLGALGNHAKNTETAKKIMDAVKKAADAAKWIVANAKPILIVSAVVLVLGNATIFIISIAQAITATPHYYCNTEANASIKKTAVYQQYCMDSNNFQLENLNGHYIIQDGSGPCTDCSINNLFMRYYALQDINYFDYLWKEDGQYSPEGQTLTSSQVVSGSLRKIINGGQSDSTNTSCKDLPNGTKAFGSRNGKYITMANWGYLRDPSLDIASYEQTSDYYVDNGTSELWVFDLSLDNKVAGTTWSVVWNYTLTINGITCVTASETGAALTSARITELLNGPSGEAGVVLYYEYPKSGGGVGEHAILVTGYEDGYWRVIDPAKGLNGGYEGPLDGSCHFAIHDNGIKNLLNSGNNSNNNYRIIRITYVNVP